jgi:hypothetical protein
MAEIDRTCTMCRDRVRQLFLRAYFQAWFLGPLFRPLTPRNIYGNTKCSVERKLHGSSKIFLMQNKLETNTHLKPA